MKRTIIAAACLLCAVLLFGCSRTDTVLPTTEAPGTTAASTEEIAETAEPAPTGPAPVEPAPTEPAPTEQTEPAGPTVCLHQWVPIQNIPAQFETNHYVVCHCGASFPDAAAWTAHRDSYLGTEDLIRHTGYASGSSKTETAPAMVVWQCSQCGATKTLNALDAP